MFHPLSRREMLLRSANGFGAAALAALLQSESRAGTAPDPFAPKKPHFPARAKSVIFLFMDGGPSQVDTFDPKPLLEKYNGKPFPTKVEPTQFNNVGNTLASPWKFKKYGQSGLPVSDLFPHVAKCVDDLAIIRSMVSNFSEHTNANYFFHSGNGQQGRPSMGAWVTYGLGSECRDLPGFVVLGSGMIPPGGIDCFGSASSRLPIRDRCSRMGPTRSRISRRPRARTARTRAAKRDLLRKLDAANPARRGGGES